MSSEKLEVTIAFGESAAMQGADGGSMRVALSTDGERGDASLVARLHRPAVVRDALLALGDALASDLRRKATDRADYLTFLIQSGKAVGKAIWDAQKEYLALLYGVAAKEDEPLPPVLTISPEAVRYEVMSRDESTYAQLVLRRPAALVDADHPGDRAGSNTTFVDLGGALAAISQMRSYRLTTLALAPTASASRVRRVPLPWLRAFGQMQAATLLAGDRFELAPIDLYNVLLNLRMRKAKTSPRALRYELLPGEPPRIVLEPWDLVVRGSGPPYRGKRPRVIRTWGRNRLNVLARILPHAKKVEVAIAGQGLPATYAVDLGDATLSLALSGWTDASWAGASTFDMLAADDSGHEIETVVAALAKPLTEVALADRIGRSKGDTRRILMAALAQLRIGHDLGSGELYVRPVTATPIPPERLKFRDPREAAAHRLLGEAGAVTLTKVADQGLEGVAIEGAVVDAKARRSFHPGFTIDREGNTRSPTCTCTAFRRSGVKEGPCEHMIALRVQYAREQAQLEAARATPEGRAAITAETRILMRRTNEGAETFRISLDNRIVTARFGIGDALRVQRVRFDSIDDARLAYFGRLEELATKGFLDATQD